MFAKDWREQLKVVAGVPCVGGFHHNWQVNGGGVALSTCATARATNGPGQSGLSTGPCAHFPRRFGTQLPPVRLDVKWLQVPSGGNHEQRWNWDMGTPSDDSRGTVSFAYVKNNGSVDSLYRGHRTIVVVQQQLNSTVTVHQVASVSPSPSGCPSQLRRLPSVLWSRYRVPGVRRLPRGTSG